MAESGEQRVSFIVQLFFFVFVFFGVSGLVFFLSES